MTAPLNKPRNPPYKIAGLVATLVIAVVFVLVFFQFRGDFLSRTQLTVRADRSGLSMDTGGKVTYNGVSVGRVAAVKEVVIKEKRQAELTLDVAFSVVIRPGLTAADVRRVAAFPVAAAQVRRWLTANLPNAEVVPTNSNAAAAVDVTEGRADAGITTALAADRYQLPELAKGIVDEPNARTRFVLAGPPGRPPARTSADRTSVVLRIDNRPGALVAALTEFGIRDIDLTRIESRPTRTELGTYMFFLDCVGHIDDNAVAEALKALHRRCADVRYLGSWPTGSVTGAVPPEMDEATRWLERLREGKKP